MRQKIGRLDCLKRKGENERDVIVLLHGFGADAGDLFPLGDMLDPDGQCTFICPQAPHEVAIGPGMTGRGWFPISVRDLEQGVDFSQVRPPGLDSSAEMVSELIFELNPERLVLGGFSQGAMVATDVTLASPNDVAGLAIWSGTMLDEAGWTKKAKDMAGHHFIQSHGGGDAVLPYQLAERLYQLLKSNGAEGQLIGFGGGHEIPMNVLRGTAEFVKRILD
jgi:phospholipase/carboxylesterase